MEFERGINGNIRLSKMESSQIFFLEKSHKNYKNLKKRSVRTCLDGSQVRGKHFYPWETI